MSSSEVLWRQRANPNANTIVHLGNFIYEFLGARITYIAFIALFNFAALGFPFFDKVFTFGIALFLYYIITDAFNVFWIGINLEYAITSKGIFYKWGVFRTHELKLNFDEITTIYIVRNNKRNAIIFENVDELKNGDYGFSKEIYFSQLSFEKIGDIQSVLEILQSKKNADTLIRELPKSNKVDTWLTNSNLYYKFLQLLSLTFLYLSSSIGLHLVDNNLLSSKLVTDKVVSQKIKEYDTKSYFYKLLTSNGYSFVVSNNYIENFTGEQVELIVSPIYKNVIELENIKHFGYQRLENGYHGFAKIFLKLTALFLSLWSACYIFYKRYIIPLEDLSILLLLPGVYLVFSLYVFHT